MTESASRRAFLAGATAAGIGAIVASQLPGAAQAAESTQPVKLVADLSKTEFEEYWLHRHGPFATKMIKQLGGCRYVQSHVSNPALTTLITASRGQVGKAYHGLTEVWFPSRNAPVATITGC